MFASGTLHNSISHTILSQLTEQKRLTSLFQRLIASLPYLRRTLAIVWEAARFYLIAWAVVLFIQALLPVLLVVLVRETVNLLLAYTPESDVTPLAVSVVLTGIVFVGQQYLSSVSRWLNIAQGRHVSDYMREIVQNKATTLDLSYFETANYYDQLHRARMDARMRPTQLISQLGTLARNGLTLIGMAGLLLSYAVWLIPVLLLATLPAFYVLVHFTRRLNEWRLRNTSNERLMNYQELVLTGPTQAPEVRIFGLSDYYRNQFRTTSTQVRNEQIRLEGEQMLANIAATTIGVVVTAGVLLWAGLRVLSGAATYGDLVAFYQIFSQGQGQALQLLNSAGSIYENLLFLENLFEFLDLEPNIRDEAQREMIPLPLQDGIRFQGVDFRYPQSERAVFTDFDWDIPAGKIVALVGENGQGKSTLLKLLCRLYDPTGGSVCWDGVDLRALPLSEVHGAVTVLFQTPTHYFETARHNIGVGAIESELDDDTIQRAAQAAGVHEVVRKLPQEYETLLGKWFGGEELSGGEWQRLALARAFVRDAAIIVLDEPTSALDSWAEMDWYDRFRQIAAGRTTMLITHRFTTAMQADLICVLHGNRIIERGTHDELIAQGGHYATSWHAQMQNA